MVGELGLRRGEPLVNFYKSGRVSRVLFATGGGSQFFVARKKLFLVA